MSRIRSISLGVMLCAVAAMLALSMLPPEHLHTSHAGASVVHRHAVDDATERAGQSVDHDGHRAVTTLEPTYVSERQFEIDGPLTTRELLLVAPARRLVYLVEPIDPLETHGPPLRIRSLRAPPA